MRNRTRAIAVGLSLAASVLLIQGSALGAATGNDRGGPHHDLPRVVQ